MEPSTQRPPNGAVYGEVRIGRGSRHRQHRHAVVSHPTPNTQGGRGHNEQLSDAEKFCRVLAGYAGLLVGETTASKTTSEGQASNSTCPEHNKLLIPELRQEEVFVDGMDTRPSKVA